jgi:glycolate oxidase
MQQAKVTRLFGPIYPDDRLLRAPQQLAAYECDALTSFRSRPLAVVLPVDEAEVIETVRVCHQQRIPFVARGSGTSLSGGSLPLEDGIVIALNRLNRILEINPRNRIARVQPGVFNLKVTAAASPYGLYYAPDPSSQQVCTIGGNIAFNSGGAHCLKHGMTSNHVLGLKVVLPDGEIAELGGPSLEGSGPDVTGLFVGSEGLFGIALEITLRLLPKPQAYRTVMAAYPDLGQAGDTVARVIAAGLLPGAMEIMDRLAIKAAEAAVGASYPAGAGAVLIVELDGDQADVDSEFELLRDVIADSRPFEFKIAADADERARIWKGRKGAFSSVGRLSPDYVVQDGVVPRGRLGEALSEIERLSSAAKLNVANVFHAGDGNLHPLILFDGTEPGALEKAEELAGRILEMCIRMGGSITGEHGVGVEKREFLPRMFTEADMTVFRRLRDTVDPDRLANRGKMLSCEEAVRSVAPAPPPDDISWSRMDATFTPEEIRELRECVLEQRVLRICGAGTKPALTASNREAAILQTRKLCGMIDYEPTEFVFTASAGTPLSEIEKHLDREGQFLPFDPVLVARGSTLGGAVASGMAGPGRLRYGGPRDFVIGVKLVTGLGEVVSGGGRVVKNAAGFDLPKLMVGSCGTLGVLVELTLKVFPRPQEFRTLIVDCRSLEAALNTLHTAGCSPITFEAIDLKPPGFLMLRLGGRPGAVETRTAAARQLLGGGEVLSEADESAVWKEATEFEWVPDGWSLWKVPLSPTLIRELETALEGSGCRRRYSVGGNLGWLAADGGTTDLLETLSALSLNAVPLFGGPGPDPAAPRRVSQFSARIKRALDPHGRFPEI